MTVIAWDGKTLAADKRAIVCGSTYTVTKIHRVADGLVAFTGGGAHAAELLNWFHGARDPATYPRCTDDSGAGSVHIDTKGRISTYSSANPFPEHVEDRHFARGCARDYAMAAMYLGHDARRAVEVACALDAYCGNGVDTLSLE
jgi:hypothetical protein